MKKLTSLLFVFVLIISSLYMGVSKWDIIKSHSLSLGFLRNTGDEKKISELKAKVKQLQEANSELTTDKNKIQSSLDKYKTYSTQLKEYAETLTGKYNVLQAQYSLKEGEFKNQKQLSVGMIDKINQYNKMLSIQQGKMDTLFLQIKDQSASIQKLSDLSTQVTQINTTLLEQQSKQVVIERSPASISPKVKVAPKIKVIYKKPVDKFN